MKAFFALIAMTLLSVSSFAANKAPIRSEPAFQIVQILKKLEVKPIPSGSDDTGYANIQDYFFMGMNCQTAVSNGGYYGARPEAACFFEDVKDLGALQAQLLEAGLDQHNPIFN